MDDTVQSVRRMPASMELIFPHAALPDGRDGFRVRTNRRIE